MQLDFEEELQWTASSFMREVREGYIQLKFEKNITCRNSNLDVRKNKSTLSKMKKRLCGNGRDPIDICHLYVTYDYAGYCLHMEECIEIKDIRPAEKITQNDCDYISGYAQEPKDGSILIVFGK